MNFTDCTLLMMTCERSDFLSRAMRYWSSINIKVIVADGSKKPFLDAPRSVQYMHYPNMSVKDRLIKLVDNLKTEYAVFVPDDDFLGFESLEKCLFFLRNNKDYSSVQGLYSRFFITNIFNKILHEPNAYDYARNYHWDDNSYMTRLLNVNEDKIMHYCYSVTTKDTLRTFKALFSGLDSSLGVTFFETLMTYAIAITGKIKTIEYFYCARQTQRPDWKKDIIYFEEIIRNKGPQYQKLIENIACELRNQYGVKPAKAKYFAEKVNKKYLETINKKNKNKKNKNKKNNLLNNEIYKNIKYKLRINLYAFGIIIKRRKFFIKGPYNAKNIFNIKSYIEFFNNNVFNIEYFNNNEEAFNSFLRDWGRIKKVIKEVRVRNIKY